MKQKYSIFKNDKEKKLIIKEFAELDKDMMFFLCEETYDTKAIKAEMAKGKRALISAIRTHNLFPNKKYADEMAEAIMSVYESKGDQSVDLLFDDIDMLSKRQKPLIIDDEIENETSEIDELLEEDAPEPEIDDEGQVEKVLNPLKAISDDSADTKDKD
jgi:hypothetical protein